MRDIVEQLETLLDSERGLRMLFDEHRESRADRALRIVDLSDAPVRPMGVEQSNSTIVLDGSRPHRRLDRCPITVHGLAMYLGKGQIEAAKENT